MREKADTADARIAVIASRQHGVVSQAQLIAAGLSTSGISRRVAAGRLYRIHRGVYAVGHAGLSRHGRLMAAVFACGEGALVSHRSAAELWELLKPRDGATDISIRASGGRRQRSGIRLHRRRSLSPADATRRRNIPVTKPARTIADLREAVPDAEVRRAIRQAGVLGLPLGEESLGDRTRGDLEGDFLKICERHRLPPPEVNVRVGPYLVDFLWRDYSFAIETDSYGYHGGRQAFRDDRRRDLELRRLGFEVRRLSEEQIESEPELVAGVLREVLASARRRVERDGAK